MIQKYINRALFCVVLWTLLTGAAMSASAQTLVWEENFTATTINSSIWTYDFGNGSERDAGLGWGNAELEYYTSRPENARIESGSLIIEAKREAFQGSAFTSARLKTEGRMHFKYGTIEARIKLPNMTKGLWPAFWTLGTIGGGWPSIGEMDIMEAGNGSAMAAGIGNRQVTAAAHWSNATGGHQYTSDSRTAAVDLSLDYHLYKMVWTAQSLTMYLDNVAFYTIDISNPADPKYNEFHTPHFLLLNVAVGGAYTGVGNAAGVTAPLPGQMSVDYVKLYQNAGDYLFIADNVPTPSGNYGVLTDNTPTLSGFILLEQLNRHHESRCF
jgi:beta-glucanase (GH16 family)